MFENLESDNPEEIRIAKNELRKVENSLLHLTRGASTISSFDEKCRSTGGVGIHS